MSVLMERVKMGGKSKSSSLPDNPKPHENPPPSPGSPSTQSTATAPQPTAPPDTALYSDDHITCTATTLTIRHYYFPAGSKIIPLATISGVENSPLGLLSGRGRIWGTANSGIWAHLDFRRPSKTEGILLELATQRVRPLITPDNVPALLDVLVRYTGS